eukprot:1461248-Pleurochrysis_carterae.AAC.1
MTRDHRQRARKVNTRHGCAVTFPCIKKACGHPKVDDLHDHGAIIGKVQEKHSTSRLATISMTMLSAPPEKNKCHQMDRAVYTAAGRHSYSSAGWLGGVQKTIQV